MQQELSPELKAARAEILCLSPRSNRKGSIPVIRRNQLLPGFGGMRWLSEELDRAETRPLSFTHVSRLLASPKGEIPFGSPLDQISKLGGLHRQLFQDTDFHSTGGTLLKKRADDEDAMEEDPREASPEVLEALRKGSPYRSHRKVTVKPETLALPAEMSPDLLRTVRVVERQGGEQEKLLVGWIQAHQELWREEQELRDADGGPTDALNEETARGLLTFPSAEVLWDEDGEEIGDPGEDRELGVTFSLSFPRDSYRVVERARPNWNSEHAERRIKYQKFDLERVDRCRSLQELEALRTCLGGSYQEDNELLAIWSDEQWARDRELALRTLRNQGPDRATIQGKLYAWFDRQARVTRPVYQDGELITPGRVTKPSIWDQMRSRAFQELNHTRAQWNSLYEAISRKALLFLTIQARNVRDMEDQKSLAENLGRWQYRLSRDQVKEVMSRIGESIRENNLSRKIWLRLRNNPSTPESISFSLCIPEETVRSHLLWLRMQGWAVPAPAVGEETYLAVGA